MYLNLSSAVSNMKSDRLSVPKDVAYAHFLRGNPLAYLQITENVLALLDLDRETNTGHLSKTYVILERTYNQHLKEYDYTCSCKKKDCLHITEISSLASPCTDSITNGPDTFEYEYLTQNLIGIYENANNSYSILRHTPEEIKCLKCKPNVTSCVHTIAFDKYKPTPSQANIRSPHTFKSVSTEMIPYQFAAKEDIETVTGYLTGMKKYPTHLIPTYDEAKMCEHGYFFSDQYKKLCKAELHLGHFSITCEVYYRPALGNCQCKQYYDGRSDLLLNLDNQHLYPYVWMIDILHKTLETQFTLHAQFRSARRTMIMCGQGNLQMNYEDLRRAYNAFLCLLDVPEATSTELVGESKACMDQSSLRPQQELNRVRSTGHFRSSA